MNIRFRFTGKCMRCWFLCIQRVRGREERKEVVLLVILSVIDKLASATNRETRRKSSATLHTAMHTEWTGHRLGTDWHRSLALHCVPNILCWKDAYSTLALCPVAFSFIYLFIFSIFVQPQEATWYCLANSLGCKLVTSVPCSFAK